MSQIDVSLLDSKQFKKAAKKTSEHYAKEILGKATADLREVVAQCSIAVSEAKNETAANENYIKSKDVVDTFNKATRETVAPHEAIKNLALAVLKSRKDHK
jgi:hypothetical protein